MRLFAAVLVMAITACTGKEAVGPGPVATSDRVVVEDLACARDVVDAVVGEVRCQVVVVPEQRQSQGGEGAPVTRSPDRRVRIHVTRIAPPGGAVSEVRVLVAGTNLATTPNYLGIAPLAQRTGRELVVVDARGTGHSVPSLDCPEVHRAATEGLALGSEEAAGMVEEGVTACAQRLKGEGVGVANYGLTELAEDLEDVRRALGLDRVDVVSYGSASGIVVPFVTKHPEQVRSVVLDAPVMTGVDASEVGVARLSWVADELVAACRRDEGCARRYPGGVGDIDAVRQVVAREPLLLRLPPAAGTGASPLVLDEERFLRVLRQMTSDGGSSGAALTLGSVPRYLYDVAHRDAAALEDWLAPILASQEAFCLGRSPACLLPRHHTSVGAWLNLMCRNSAVPEQDGAAGVLQRLDGGRSLCKPWGLTEQLDSPDVPARWTVPTLVATGKYATFASPDVVRAAMSGVAPITWLEDPAAGMTVIARTPCALGLRDAWLADPTRPVDPSCLLPLSVEWH